MRVHKAFYNHLRDPIVDRKWSWILTELWIMFVTDYLIEPGRDKTAYENLCDYVKYYWVRSWPDRGSFRVIYPAPPNRSTSEQSARIKRNHHLLSTRCILYSAKANLHSIFDCPFCAPRYNKSIFRQDAKDKTTQAVPRVPLGPDA